MIYISYGIPKSASSFVFQIAEKAGRILAERQGIAYFSLQDLFPNSVEANFAESAIAALELSQDEKGLEKLIRIIQTHIAERNGGVVVLKTHLGCSQGLSQFIGTNKVKASVCYRHPADMLLSRMDMVRRDGEPYTFDQIKAGYRDLQIPIFYSWANITGVEKFYFDDIVRYPTIVAEKVAKQFGLDIDPHELVYPLLADKSQIMEFNKGLINRRATEMSHEQQQQIEVEFEPYIQYIEQRNQNKFNNNSVFAIAIVTPTLNSLKTVDETILSVITQRGDFFIRYHIQDGGSTDGTQERLQQWSEILSSDSPLIGCKGIEFSYSVEQDTGVYNALNRGFAHVSGDLYTWLGSDDRLMPGALQAVWSLVEEHKDIHWVTGTLSLLREDGIISAIEPNHYVTFLTRLFPQSAIAAGLADGEDLAIIQQEGTFWTDTLWQKVGRKVRDDLRLAGDFELWTRMAKHTDLVSVQAPLGSFRFREGQLSGDMSRYMAEVRTIQQMVNEADREHVRKQLTHGKLSSRVASARWFSHSWTIKHVHSAPQGNPEDSYQQQLAEKEKVIQSLSTALHAYKTAFRATFMIRLPCRLTHRLKEIIRPRLGNFNQYAPRPLQPTQYLAHKILTHGPRVSIVTPSYEQGVYIERTMKSVFDQNYPNLEYYVQDGASTDETATILQSHEDNLTGWCSEKDDGQAQAINRGFEKTTGEIMAWLNSDDQLLPGTIAEVVSYFEQHPDVDVVYGNRLLIDENDMEIGRWILPGHDSAVLSWADYVPQETLFWRRRIWERVGGHVDETFKFAMDWDLLVRFRDAGAKFAHIPQFLGAFRVHQAQKTSSIINETGKAEMERIRARTLGRTPSPMEIRRKVLPFLIRHVWADLKFRLRTRCSGWLASD